MQSTAAFNLAPVGALLGVGLVLAVLPCIWVMRRHATAAGRYRALALLTLFLTFDLLVVGAFTRLTDSGLGCPDWPGCYGESNPLAATSAIGAAESAMPTGPVTQTKAWIEMIHRYLATGVGALILSLALFHLWLQRQPDSGVKASWWPWLSLVWVCVQGAFGALTVTMKLFPLIVTLHLLGGLALLALLTVQARLAAPRAPNAGAYVPEALPRVWLAVALLVLFAQAALGAWVSTNYAVLACNTIPMCQDQWWPAMDFAAGFALWRELGHTAQGAILPFEALTAIHMVHRLFAVAAFVVLGLLIHRLFAVGRKRTAQWLLVLTGMQLLTGLSNVILGWPLLAALLHTGGAGAMTMVLTSELAGEGVA